jgi:DNA-binding phage protein
MNLLEMHEQIRTMCLHIIARGDVTSADLSRRTGLSRSHVSKFLHAHGQLSFTAAHRILKALHLEVEAVVNRGHQPQSRAEHEIEIPLVSHSAALFEPEIRAHAVERWLFIHHRDLPPPGPGRSLLRQSWRRFIAIRIDRDGARSMGRPEYAGAIAVIDRHYSSLRLYAPPRPNLYAIRDGNQVALRYIERVDNYLVYFPANRAVLPKVTEVAQNTNAGHYIAGRVAMIQHRI